MTAQMTAGVMGSTLVSNLVVSSVVKTAAMLDDLKVVATELSMDASSVFSQAAMMVEMRAGL